MKITPELILRILVSGLLYHFLVAPLVEKVVREIQR